MGEVPIFTGGFRKVLYFTDLRPAPTYETGVDSYQSVDQTLSDRIPFDRSNPSIAPVEVSSRWLVAHRPCHFGS